MEHLQKTVFEIGSLMHPFDIDVLSFVENNITFNHASKPLYISASYILPSEIAENFDLTAVRARRLITRQHSPSLVP